MNICDLIAPLIVLFCMILEAGFIVLILSAFCSKNSLSKEIKSDLEIAKELDNNK